LLGHLLKQERGRLTGEIRPAISVYVAGVIISWEPPELIARFEAEIRPDPAIYSRQRAVLGVLIGSGIFGLNMLLGWAREETHEDHHKR
jgi:hypothetical protein